MNQQTFFLNNILIKCILLIIGLQTLASTHAQVTIGSSAPANRGTLLDLKQNIQGLSNKGILPPRVYLTKVNQLYPMLENNPSYTNGSTKDEEDKKHVGLFQYVV